MKIALLRQSALRLSLGAAIFWPLPAAVLAQSPQATAPGAGAITRNRVVSLLPEDRKPLVLKTSERNPYARRNPDVDLITDDSNQETEADTIRDILNSLPITGRSYGPQGLRVLAGDIIFERGKLVDQVIENQSENLIVELVNETSIELAWIDTETRKLTGKRLILPYDLTPKVRYVLKGPKSGDGDGDTLKFGIVAPRLPEAPLAGKNPTDRGNAGHSEKTGALPAGVTAEAPIKGQ